MESVIKFAKWLSDNSYALVLILFAVFAVYAIKGCNEDNHEEVITYSLQCLFSMNVFTDEEIVQLKNDYMDLPISDQIVSKWLEKCGPGSPYYEGHFSSDPYRQ